MYRNSVLIIGMILSFSACLSSAPKKKDELNFCVAWSSEYGESYSVCGTRKQLIEYMKQREKELREMREDGGISAPPENDI